MSRLPRVCVWMCQTQEKEEALAELRQEEEQHRWSLTTEYGRERASLLARIAQLSAKANKDQSDDYTIEGPQEQHEKAIKTLGKEWEEPGLQLEDGPEVLAVKEQGESRLLQERVELEALLSRERKKLGDLKRDMHVEIGRALQAVKEAEEREKVLKAEKEAAMEALEARQNGVVMTEEIDHLLQLLRREMEEEKGRELQALRERMQEEAGARVKELRRRQEEDREALLRTAETEWKTKLADIARKTKALQSALVKIGAKVGGCALDSHGAGRAVPVCGVRVRWWP